MSEQKSNGSSNRNFWILIAIIVVGVGVLYIKPDLIKGKSGDVQQIESTLAAQGKILEQLAGTIAQQNAPPATPPGPDLTKNLPDGVLNDQVIMAINAEFNRFHEVLKKLAERDDMLYAQMQQLQTNMTNMANLNQAPATTSTPASAQQAAQSQAPATVSPQTAPPQNTDVDKTAVQLNDAEKSVLLYSVVKQIQQNLWQDQPIQNEVLMLSRAEDPTIGPKVQELKTLTEQNIPTMAALQQSFKASIPEILKTANDDTSALSKLQSLVTVRPVGEEAKGDGAAAIVARAEAALVKQDLSRTLFELEKLTPEAKKPIEGWLVEARRRQNAINLAQEMNQLLMERIQN